MAQTFRPRGQGCCGGGRFLPAAGGKTDGTMVYRLIGFWVLRRGIRILTADDPRPLRERLTGQAKRILVGAAITAGLLVIAALALIAVLIALVT